MGSGKSTIGPLLAARLGCPFVDSDAEIEREAGRRVAEIFAQEGEAGFRAREAAAVERLAQEPAVVALGGGAIAQPGLRERLRGRGVIVYLRASVESLAERIGGGDDRPLLRGLPPGGRRERLRALLAEREALYESAELRIDTDRASPEALVSELVRLLDGLGGVGACEVGR